MAGVPGPSPARRASVARRAGTSEWSRPGAVKRRMIMGVASARGAVEDAWKHVSGPSADGPAPLERNRLGTANGRRPRVDSDSRFSGARSSHKRYYIQIYNLSYIRRSP